MVDMVVNQAAVVTDAHRTDYTGAFVVWAELERLALELADPHAEQIRPVLVAAADEQVAILKTVAECGAPRHGGRRLGERWARAHAAFHGAVLEAADSARLRESLEATTARITRQALWDALAERPYPLRRAVEQHAAIAKLLGVRPGDACECMHEHILGLGDAFLQRWDWNAADGSSS
jgi:DNA-binding GntR family transcriptional regulator